MFCKNCGKENNDNDKFCSSCGQNLLENIDQTTNNDKSNNGCSTKGCGIGCFVLVILFILGSLLSSSDTNSESGSNSFSNDISTQQSMAKFHCQEAVKEKLKNPDGATFPDITEHSFENLGNMVYTVKSYVNATNSFGATVRTNYSCKVKLIDEDNAKVQGVYLLSN